MTDILDLVVADDGGQQVVENHALDHVPCSGQQSTLDHVPCSGQQSGEENQFKPVLLQGKCGQGRHGSKIEREFLTYHMRSTKDLRKKHKALGTIIESLEGSTFQKNGKSFRVSAKGNSKKSSGIILSLSKEGRRGNRFVRKIHFSKFSEAAFSPSTSNVALAGRLGVHPSTIPKLQKTCAGLCQSSQSKLLLHLLAHCRKKRPLAVFRSLEQMLDSIF